MLDVTAERLARTTSIRLAVTHANPETDALFLPESARARLDPLETLSCTLSPVVGTHVDLGTLALNYMSGIE